jgi:PIN domain nuclease of toxin-antitoxin system
VGSVSAMRLLLDTHTLIWWITEPGRLSADARSAIADPQNDVYVSAASAWEISTKFRLGKLPEAAALATDLPREIAAEGFAPLDFAVEHGQDAGALPAHHRDPFDRMLIAQARAERLALVSNESLFDAYGVVRLW